VQIAVPGVGEGGDDHPFLGADVLDLGEHARQPVDRHGDVARGTQTARIKGATGHQASLEQHVTVRELDGCRAGGAAVLGQAFGVASGLRPVA
jgi:hypothetical protein